MVGFVLEKTSWWQHSEAVVVHSISCVIAYQHCKIVSTCIFIAFAKSTHNVKVDNYKSRSLWESERLL